MLKLIASIKGKLTRNSKKQRQLETRLFNTYMLKKGMELIRDYPLKAS